MSISRSFIGANVVWPPSLSIAIQRSPTGTRYDTPRPASAPTRPITAPSRGAPPPTWCLFSGARCGSADASARRSLTTTSDFKLNCEHTASIENDQWWLVMVTQSPSIGLAIAMPA